MRLEHVMERLGGVLFALGHKQALCATAAVFLDCAFPSVADDTHIGSPLARVVEAPLHFDAQHALLGFSMQPSKCVVWSPSRLEAFAILPESVSYARDGR